MKSLKYWMFAIAMIVGGPVIALSTHADKKNIAAIINHGVAAKAEIIKVEWTTKHHIDQDYNLLVNFKTQDGTPISRKISVDSVTGNKARSNADYNTLDVQYLPEDTSVVYQADVAPPSNIGYWLAALMSIVGIIMVVRRVRR
jgi:hypothetical protein